MKIPPGFAYEYQSPVYGEAAYFVVRSIPFGQHRRFLQGLGGDWVRLTNLYVAPRYRGQGIGDQLLDGLRRWQDAMSVNVILLASPYLNDRTTKAERLHHFYNKNWFVQIADSNYHMRMAL